jgi:shikimate dehydrogenase
VAPHTQDTVWPESIALPPHLTVFDLVHSPPDTRLLHLAREAGARTIDGLSMLVRQGALSLAMWTEVHLEEEDMRALMRSACEAALRT